jgi:Protein of unknown function (DUF2794)
MSEAETPGQHALETVLNIPVRQAPPARISFDRRELNELLNLYGRMVAAGEWRDYAIDFLKDVAIFSVFRRSSEVPLYRIIKDPALARKQGAYSVVATTGLVLKRGHELSRVLRVLDRRLSVVN